LISASLRYRAIFTLNHAVAHDAAKELVKFIKDEKLRVQMAIQGDQVRVSGKKRARYGPVPKYCPAFGGL
jgi:hypothetical protein